MPRRPARRSIDKCGATPLPRSWGVRRRLACEANQLHETGGDAQQQSDNVQEMRVEVAIQPVAKHQSHNNAGGKGEADLEIAVGLDRKSTPLNSSHLGISYA